MPRKTELRRYALVNSDKKEFRGVLTQSFSWDAKKSPSPDPTPPEGFFYQRITDEDLSGLTPDEFFKKKKPIFEGKKLDHWKNQEEDPQLGIAQDTAAKDDLSNSATISITGGAPNAGYVVAASRPIACSLDRWSGILDGSGDATFKIKVLGQDPLKLTAFVEDCQNAELNVDIVPGDFV